MAHTFARLLTHYVFSTKDHAPLLNAAVKEELTRYLGGTVKNLGGKALAINGTSDHMHMLVSMPTTMSPADMMREIKANSSGWIHKRFGNLANFAWQSGYGAFSVSESNREQVAAYIANQEEHHRGVSLRDEFLALLARHGIEYDERHI